MNTDTIRNIAQKYSDLKQQFIVYFSFGYFDECKKIQLIHKYSLTGASKTGKIWLLQQFLKRNLKIQHIDNAIIGASYYGRTDVLQWFLNNNLLQTQFYSYMAIDKTRYVCVLKWWCNSGLQVKYTYDAIDKASVLGRHEILHWWLNKSNKYNLQLKYTEKAVDFAYDQQILEIWKQSGQNMIYTERAINNAKRIDILNWWRHSQCLLKYSAGAIHNAMHNQRTDILQWWLDNQFSLQQNIIYNNNHRLNNWWSDNGLMLKAKEKHTNKLQQSKTLPKIDNWLQRKKIKYHYFCNKYNQNQYHFLQIWVQKNQIPPYYFFEHTRIIIDYREISTLKWLINQSLNNGIQFDYQQFYIDNASCCNQFDILNLFLDFHVQNNLELRYSNNAIDQSSNINILNWWIEAWKMHNVKLKYTNWNIDRINFNDEQIPILDWWYDTSQKYNIDMLYTENAMDRTVSTQILQWWLHKNKTQNLRIKYSHHAIDGDRRSYGCGYYATNNTNLLVLKWWFDSGLELRYTTNAIDSASNNGFIQVLDYWKNQSQVQIKYTIKAIDNIGFYTSDTQVEVLNWWLESKLELKYTESAIDNAYNSKNKPVLDWWLQQLKNKKIQIKLSSFINQKLQDPYPVQNVNQYVYTKQNYWLEGWLHTFKYYLDDNN